VVLRTRFPARSFVFVIFCLWLIHCMWYVLFTFCPTAIANGSGVVAVVERMAVAGHDVNLLEERLRVPPWNRHSNPRTLL